MGGGLTMRKRKPESEADQAGEKRQRRGWLVGAVVAAVAVLALGLGLLFSGWLMAQSARWPRALRVAQALGRLVPAGLRAYGYGIALRSSDPRVREEAARGLEETGPEARAAVPRLARALKDREAAVRRRALEALARLGERSQEAVSQIETALKDRDWRIRERAATLLGELRQRARTAAPALVEALRDEHARVRAAAAAALGRIRARAKIAIPALEAALKDAAADVRAAARKALEQIRRQEGSHGQPSDSPEDAG